jgi:hypothetical protein
MQIAKGIIGGILLFLGQELDFLFTAAMAVLIGFRLTPLLPPQWPAYYSYIFIGLLAVIAAAVPIINKRLGYFFSGFLAGGYFFVEYYAPGVLTLPLVPFLIGAAIGTLVIGLLTGWALILASCLIGTYYVVNLFTLQPIPKTLVSGGLFLIGALTQVVIMRMRKDD